MKSRRASAWRLARWQVPLPSPSSTPWRWAAAQIDMHVTLVVLLQALWGSARAGRCSATVLTPTPWLRPAHSSCARGWLSARLTCMAASWTARARSEGARWIPAARSPAGERTLGRAQLLRAAPARPPLPPLVASPQVLAQEGWRAFYRGIVPSMLGILPYAGVDITIFEMLKEELLDEVGQRATRSKWPAVAERGGGCFRRGRNADGRTLSSRTSACDDLAAPSLLEPLPVIPPTAVRRHAAAARHPGGGHAELERGPVRQLPPGAHPHAAAGAGAPRRWCQAAPGHSPA